MSTLVHDLNNLKNPFVATFRGIVGLFFLNEVHINTKDSKIQEL
jgi:hypothetical protein